jgi:hypothetical protein
MYTSVADLRSEGVASAEASDERLLGLIDEATRLIERVTGWFFEARTMTLRLSGRGTPTLELPVPPIRLTRLCVHDVDQSLLPRDLVIVGAPIQSGSDGARITLRHGRLFSRGHGNVLIEGRFGFTEDDGTAEGRTPLGIRRAAMLLVLRNLAPLTSESALDARSRWRVIEERTRDQSYRVSPLEAASSSLTGDPDIDALLLPYLRPSALGAA